MNWNKLNMHVQISAQLHKNLIKNGFEKDGNCQMVFSVLSNVRTFKWLYESCNFARSSRISIFSHLNHLYIPHTWPNLTNTIHICVKLKTALFVRQSSIDVFIWKMFYEYRIEQKAKSVSMIGSHNQTNQLCYNINK